MRSQKSEVRSQKSERLLIIVLTILFSCNLTFSQAPGGTEFRLENCFQTVDMLNHQGPPPRMLNGQFWFNALGTFESMHYVSFTPRDENGNILPMDYSLFEDIENDFTLDEIEVGYGLYQVGRYWYPSSVEDQWAFRIQTQMDVWFNDNFSFPTGTKTVRIKLFNFANEINMYTEVLDLDVQLIDDFDDIQNIVNIALEEDCQEFESFSFNATYDYMEYLFTGFCGQFSYNLKRKPQNISDPNGINELPLNIFNPNILTSLGENCDDCWLQAVPYGYSSSPVPCGCELFDLELVIHPCDGKPNPPCDQNFKVIISDEIEVCCRCDIRDTTPPMD